MKKRMKTMLKVLAIITGVTLVGKIGTKMYFNAFGGPVTAPSRKEHWQSVKQTFGHSVARDLDTDEIIRERQADIT